jgi:Flp pilus assembly protein TadB
MSSPTQERPLPERAVRGGTRIAIKVTRGTVGRVQPATRLQWLVAALLLVPAMAVMLVLAVLVFVVLIVVAVLLAAALAVMALVVRRPSRRTP